MKKRNCYLFVFDGFADWEPALAISGLNQFTDFAVKTVAADKEPVRSMGGITVLPDHVVDAIDHVRADLLILPGGYAWQEGKNVEIKPLIDKLLSSDKTVAAICAATAFLGQHGYLDHRHHTSNHLDYYLKKMAPAYKGEAFYVREHCVTDENLITANGTATVQFAEAIFRRFNLSGAALDFWFGFFLNPAVTVA